MKKAVILLFICAFFWACTPVVDKMQAEFESINTPTEASLRGLFVVNENVIWASGSGGTVLRSVDGGKTWDNCSVPGAAKNDFRSLNARDENRAMVFGIAGPDFGYRTNNGGQTWELCYSDTTTGLFFNSLKFADDLHGLAVSDPIDGKFFVLRTNDGGESWNRVTDLPAVEAGEANFAASNTCIEFLPSGQAWIASGGLAARVFYSENFGNSWSVANTPMLRGQASSGIFSIAFKNEQEGVIVGGIYDQPEINTNIAAFTSDGGKNWLPAQKMPANFRSCVQFVSLNYSELVFAIGKTGCDISADGGKTWRFLSNNGYYTFRGVKGKPLGFAAGSDGRIARVRFTDR